MSLYLILLSNERSALGLYILYVFLISFIFFKRKKKILFLLLIVGILSLSISTSEKLKNRYVFQFLEQIKNDNSNEDRKFYIFTESHDTLFFTALKMFKDKPLIGHGTKTFRFKCENYKELNDNKNYSCNTHPHNYYVQMLAENGIIGFLFLFLVFFYFIFSFIKIFFNKEQNKVLNLIIISNIISLWPILPHANFFNNWISIIIFINFSFYIYMKKNFK